jgi:hypothetical protein
LLFSLHLSFHLHSGLKVITFLVAAARLRLAGLQHGAMREAKGAHRLGGVEAVSIEEKTGARRQLMVEQCIA